MGGGKGRVGEDGARKEEMNAQRLLDPCPAPRWQSLGGRASWEAVDPGCGALWALLREGRSTRGVVAGLATRRPV